jgi:lipopolysaccharide transport system ATP-binding protein
MSLIDVKNVGKAYKRYTSKWQRLAEWFKVPTTSKAEEKWAIKEISFCVSEGESIGIIGTNGAGKSTLLKLITGTTQPTIGSIHRQGTVAAILELGMGFHPNFTGRQNVMMSGLLLGLKAKELEQLMPEIIAFSEIGDYIDQPVRVYSSGMQMRLAFSVATAKRPDLLIIDEALAVGDVYFQHKSFERIRTFKEQGTTLLIVSHDKAAIQSVCDRAILLDKGQVILEGKPDHVMDFYNAMIAERESKSIEQVESAAGVQTLSGTGEVSITDISLLNTEQQQIETVKVGQKVTLSISATVNQNVDELVLGFLIKDRLGQSVFGTNTSNLNQTLLNLKQGENIHYQVDLEMNLGVGNYSFSIALHAAATHIEKSYEWRDLACMFSVVNVDEAKFVGVTWMPAELRCQREQ